MKKKLIRTAETRTRDDRTKIDFGIEVSSIKVTISKLMPAVDLEAIRLLEKEPLSCVQLGERLWPEKNCMRQALARPAGKIVRRLVKAGFAFPVSGDRRRYVASPSGLKELEVQLRVHAAVERQRLKREKAARLMPLTDLAAIRFLNEPLTVPDLGARLYPGREFRSAARAAKKVIERLKEADLVTRMGDEYLATEAGIQERIDQLKRRVEKHYQREGEDRK